MIVHVLKPAEQLLEVVAGLGFWEAATKSHEVEKLTTTNQFENNKVDGFGALLGMWLLACGVFDKSDDVLMIKLSEYIHLCLDELLERLVRFHDLDSVASSSCIRSKFNLAWDAAAKCSSKRVLIQKSGHSFL